MTNAYLVEDSPHISSDEYNDGIEKTSSSYWKDVLDARTTVLMNQISDLQSQKEEAIKAKECLSEQLENNRLGNLKVNFLHGNQERNLCPEEISVKSISSNLNEVIIESKESENSEITIEIRNELYRLKELVTKLKHENLEQKRMHSKEEESLKLKLDEAKKENYDLINKMEQLQIKFSRNITNAVWEGSNDAVLNYQQSLKSGSINCAVLNSGIHQWHILNESSNGDISLGVVSSEYEIDYEKWLGNQAGTWAYYNHGEAWHCNEFIGFYLGYYEKCTITLTLDLTGEGTLSYAIDGESAVTVFRNMKSKLGNNKNDLAGFIPAASLSPECAVRFLGFK